MRYFVALTAALLFTFMIVSVPAFSQADDRPQEAQGKDKDKDRGNVNDRGRVDQDQTKRDEKATRPEEKGSNDHNARQDENRQDNDRRDNHQEARPSGEHQGQHNGGYAQQGNQRPMQERGHGARIPEDRFRSSFGREHHFHVDRDRVYNQRQPVVVYGGYSFQLVDAWPADWAYSDDCYIDYDDVADQYYLYDAYHPGFRIAVIVIE
ncbi:MAG TPA: hypothetical protein VFM77_05670 [Terriglobales bacterium]|nr:hypothetical protein [Terriglobales bacterium]